MPKTLPQTIAAIDLGTNSVHLVVAKIDHLGEMRILDTDKTTLRLGSELDEHQMINQAAIKRTAEVFRHMAAISKSYNATIRAVATYATRQARNHRHLINEVFKASGILIEVIDGIEEARLEFLGMRYGTNLVGTECFAMDIGGGSTELIVARDDDIRYVTSLKLGAVTFTKRFLHAGTNNVPKQVQNLINEIHSILAPIPANARTLPFSKALASSGTAKALAYMHAKHFNNRDLSDANGYILPRKDVKILTDKLCKLGTPAKIREAFEVDASRSEIILAGALILQEVTDIFEVHQWVVSTYGLREGIVADTFIRSCEQNLAPTDRPDEQLPDIQWHSIQQFGKRLLINEVHGQQVKKLALSIHDQLLPLMKQPTDEERTRSYRQLLRSAAYLREAGKFLGAPGYHKHSNYLIANARLPGFTEAERQFMGLLARFQRKGLPSESSAPCANLSSNEVRQLRFLSGCIRLAGALDRARQNRIHRVEMIHQQGSVICRVFYDKDHFPDVELHKAALERSALEKSFGYSITLEPVANP